VSKSYINKVELKDGQIILFHRPNAKRPVYHMRVHVRGMRDVHGEGITYIQETTGETDLDEAKRMALERFDDLKLRVRAKAPAKELSFKDMYELWWTEKCQDLNATFKAKGRTGKTERIVWYEKYSQRYFLPYFGDYKLDSMSQKNVQDFWPWRLSYWERASDDEKRKHPNHALSPSKKTLDMEQSALREIFGWAHANKLVAYMPQIKHPLSRKGIAAKRRASFDPKEWQKLESYMAKWAKGEGINDKRVNSSHIYRRQLCRQYILWLFHTGMRTGEANQLRHKDIVRIRTDETESVTLRVTVSQQTKTGSRNVITQAEAYGVYEDICKLTGHTESDDWLFCNSDGKKLKGFYKTLDKLLEDVGLLYDENNDKRVMYSFRHLYAENRLRDIGVNPRAYDLLSANMGTSRKMIEDHYVRKGVMYDEDALIGGDKKRSEEIKARKNRLLQEP